MTRLSRLLCYLLCLATGISVCAAAYFYIGAGESASAPKLDHLAPPLPIATATPETHTPFLNAKGDAAYVGTAACVDCHANQHDAYLKTRHSQAMAQVAPEEHPPNKLVEHPFSGQRFRVTRRGGALWHESWLPASDGQQFALVSLPVHYVVGSGHFGRSYLSKVDGFLVQSPLTWYAPRGEWGMSPGFDQPDHQGFRRLISAECLFCHSGRVRPVKNNDYRVKIVETAIGCERCHGPGSLHVEKQLYSKSSRHSRSSAIDDTIVNPAHLSRKLAEAICQQCHLQGDVQVAVRGRRFDDFRPGLPLEDFRLEYRLVGDDSQMTIVGHVEQLHASPCYQQSETLTCTTCHEPHHAPKESEAAKSRASCLNCHGGDAPKACSLPIRTRQEKSENDCLQCHMPKSPTEVPHVAFTHHRIGVFPMEGGSSSASHVQLLEPLQDLSRLARLDRKRALALALMKLLGSEANRPELREGLLEAAQMLSEVYEAGLRDAEVTSQLANHALREGDFGAAEQLAREAAAESPHPTDSRVAALSVLGQLRFRERDFDAAIPFYRELTQIRRSASHALYLGVCEQRRGNLGRAIKAFQQSLAIEPLQTAAHIALALAFESDGKQARARQHRDKAEQVARLWRTSHSQNQNN